MRIEEITFNNFRKYIDTKVSFNKKDNDLHVIIADNGAGKTTFLNALTWCLYNEEPKIKNDKEALPTLNTDVSNNSEKDIEIASVSITVSGDGIKLIFKRSDIFKIHGIHSDYFEKNNKREEWINQKFSVTEIIDGKHNVIEDPVDCDLIVSSFIPEGIKEFFFFDGEQLDNYFLSSTAIKSQVFTLSHIFLLDDMGRRLNEKLKTFRRKGSPNETADDKLKEFNNVNDLITSESERLENLTTSYNSQELELKHLMNVVGDEVSLKDTEEKRNENIARKDKFKGHVADKKALVMDLLIKESPKILAKDAFIKSLNLIEENKDEGYVYPVDESILVDSISEKSCKLCDRELDNDLIELLKSKKARLFLISPEDKILNDNNKIFKRFLNVDDSYVKNLKSLQNEINDLEDAIESLEEDIKKAYDTIKVHSHLRESIDRRDELIEILPTKKSELDSLKDNITKLESKAEKLDQEYDNLCSKEKEYQEILAKKKLCQESINVIEKVKEDMMGETRKEIENVTKDNFFYLIRKSNTYGDIYINENYEVKLFDEDGRPALYSASASEVELLALAFTLAIHSVSGYESPLVMDTILARTTGEQKINVAKGCLDISKNKQGLLFLMDDEYSEPVKKLFLENGVSEYSLVESESEKEIIIMER